MVWVKLLGIFLVFLCCSLCGVLAAGRYSGRVRELSRAKAIIQALNTRLSYTLDTPQALIGQVCAINSLCCDYLTQTRLLMSQGLCFSESWYTALDTSSLPLEKEDRQLLAGIGAILGASDLETQQMQLTLLFENLDIPLNIAKTKNESGARLCTTLGMLAGLAVGVLLL